MTAITLTYLEQTSPDDVRPAKEPQQAVEVRLVERHAEIDKVTRVWLHTNTLDGPHALANYQARGLRPYKTEQEERTDLDGPPPGPWPGARVSSPGAEVLRP